MPSSDYTAVTPGGLKLKGVKSKITKPSKKRQNPNPISSKATADAITDTKSKNAKQIEDTNVANTEISTAKAEEHDSEIDRGGKTEAELRHEERRRRRLDERLKREGTKTHKERVEELNRYLSNLIEDGKKACSEDYSRISTQTLLLLERIKNPNRSLSNPINPTHTELNTEFEQRRMQLD